MMTSQHQSVLTSNRLLVVRSLKVTETLLACLREDYTLTNEMQQEIEAERTESRKAGALLDTLMRRGDKAFSQFIRALVESDQDKLALALDGNLAQCYIDGRNSTRGVFTMGSFRNDALPAPSSGQQSVPMMMMMMANPNAFSTPQPSIAFPMQMVTMMPQQSGFPPNMMGFGMIPSYGQPAMNITSMTFSGALVSQPSESVVSASSVPSITYSDEELKSILEEINGSPPFSPQKVMNFKIQRAVNSHLASDPMVYPMQQVPRGRAVIINNKKFHESLCLSERGGAECDVENLTNLFHQLSFTVVTLENKTAKEIYRFLKEESQHPDHSKADMFVLFLMSHGNEGNIYGIDGETLSIEKDIAALFYPEKCHALIGKPKVFFIQACQGSEITPTYGRDSDKWEPPKDEEVLKKMEKLSIIDKEGFVPGYNKKSDMVMSYATVKGNFGVFIFISRCHFFWLSKIESQNDFTHYCLATTSMTAM